MKHPPRIPAAPFVLTLIGLGAFLTALDQTVVVTALPAVMLDLKIPFIELDQEIARDFPGRKIEEDFSSA